MENRFRIRNSYHRESEEDRVAPLRIFFLSVEGNKTEVEYFEGIERFKDMPS